MQNSVHELLKNIVIQSSFSGFLLQVIDQYVKLQQKRAFRWKIKSKK